MKKAIVVTGGASGIGKACVDTLISEGNTVISVDLNISESSSATQQVAVDVTDEAAIAAMFQELSNGGFQITGLVNAAGRGGGGHTHSLDFDEWSDVISLNLNGTFLMCKHALRSMLEAGTGAIVNISSVVGMQALTGATQYSASKAAVLGLTRTIALDYAGRGIRCNAVLPGYIETPGVGHMKDDVNKIVRDKIISFQNIGRAGQPKEVASVISFLLGESASFVTGASIPVDGGWLSGQVVGAQLTV